MYKKNIDRFRHIHNNINELSKYYLGKPNASNLAHDHTVHSINHWEIPYSSSLNLLNLNYLNSVDFLDNSSCFLVRDGLFLTMDFFNRCLKNRDLRSILLFHHGLKDFIPQEWAENILFFEYEYAKKTELFHFSRKSSKKLLLKFNLLKSCFSPERIYSFLDKIDHYQEIILCFPLHETNYFLSSQWDGGLFLHSTYETIEKIKEKCRQKSDKVSSTPLKYLQSTNDLDEYDYYDISASEHYYIDDYTNYHCLFSGANPLMIQSASAHAEDVYFPLSFNHGLRILSRPDKKDLAIERALKKGLSELSIRPGEKFNTSAFQLVHSLTKENTSFSWPKFFI